MTRYRLETITSGITLGDFEADDEESAIRALVEDTGCTDEIGNDLRVVEVVCLGQWTGTLEAASYYMDDEIRERLQANLRCHDQEWLDTYCREHETAFGENFVIN
jgi:hypothetical protein